MENHAVANYKKPEVGFVKLFVLSLSTSRYPSSTFGEYIRKTRLEKWLRQAGVAMAINVDEITVVNWERVSALQLN